jgi:hypothetical protein
VFFSFISWRNKSCSGYKPGNRHRRLDAVIPRDRSHGVLHEHFAIDLGDQTILVVRIASPHLPVQ